MHVMPAQSGLEIGGQNKARLPHLHMHMSHAPRRRPLFVRPLTKDIPTTCPSYFTPLRTNVDPPSYIDGRNSGLMNLALQQRIYPQTRYDHDVVRGSPEPPPSIASIATSTARMSLGHVFRAVLNSPIRQSLPGQPRVLW